MLPHIDNAYPDHDIVVVCQDHIAELYEPSPHVSEIITFNRNRIFTDPFYARQIVRQLGSLAADLVLNSVYSPESITHLLALGAEARESVALEGDLNNISAEQRAHANQHYTRLIPTPVEWLPEVERHRDFLAALDIRTSSLGPIVWTTAGDDDFALRWFGAASVDASRTIALFPGAQGTQRAYDHYPEVIEELHEFSFVVLGGTSDAATAAALKGAFPGRVHSVAGETTLRQAAAMIRQCCAYLGTESSGAHLACAVGTPNVVMLGGGFFGRFMPYTPLTTCVSTALDCFRCRWHCTRDGAECIAGISPGVLAGALRYALSTEDEDPTIFVEAGPDSRPGSDHTGMVMSFVPGRCSVRVRPATEATR
jgi:ADP-heptose:LPS heptosyltransferase